MTDTGTEFTPTEVGIVIAILLGLANIWGWGKAFWRHRMHTQELLKDIQGQSVDTTRRQQQEIALFMKVPQRQHKTKKEEEG